LICCSIPLVCGAGCGVPPAPPCPPAIDPLKLDGARALEAVQDFVAIGPRVSGTEGARVAAEYLARKLREAGIESEIDIFEDETPEGPVTFRNVIGRIPGRGNKKVVLLSHFDTKAGIDPAFVGANDSGSSTGLLLELGRVLAAVQPRQFEIVLAFVDGEECRKRYSNHDGLHGSRRLVSRLKAAGEAERVLAVIVMDMIGDADLQVTLPRNGSAELISMAFSAAREEGARRSFRLLGADILDDHVPFLLAGIPAVDIIDFQYGSEPRKNDYWHTPEDTMDKLSADSLRIVGRVVLRMLNALDKSGDSLRR